MSNTLQSIAARYASALKASDGLTSQSAGDARPSTVEICLWKLEDVVGGLVTNVTSRGVPHGDYDHQWLYAHRYCLRSREDVSRAPDDVLLEALRLDRVAGWGWLQFLIREINWLALLVGNWGLPTFCGDYGGGGNGAFVRQAEREERWAQAAIWFRDVMKDLGVDVFAQLAEAAEGRKAEMGLDEAGFVEWLREFNEMAYITYTCRDVMKPELLSKPGKCQYPEPMRTEFLTKIRAGAASRRRNHFAEWSCDCLERQKKADEEQGLAEELAGVEHALKGDAVTHRGDDIGAAPVGEELLRLTRHFEEWMSSEPNIRNTYLHDRLEIFLARNPQARELLRLPENRKFAAEVKREVRWLYLPDWTFAEGGGVSHIAA